MKIFRLLNILLVFCLIQSSLKSQNYMHAEKEGTIIKGRLISHLEGRKEVIVEAYIFALSKDKKQVLGYTKTTRGYLSTNGGVWEISELPKNGEIILIGFSPNIKRQTWMQEVLVDGRKYIDLGDNIATLPTPKSNPAQLQDLDGGVGSGTGYTIIQSLLVIGWIADIYNTRDYTEQIDNLTDNLLQYVEEKEKQDQDKYLSTDELVAYYPFNGNAKDFSGNNKHGVIEGATSTIDRFNNLNSAYEFDGSNDRIVIPRNDYSYEESITFNFWFKTDNLDQEGYFLHGFETTSVTSFALILYPTSQTDQIQFDYDLENGRYNWFGFSISDNILPNKWYMLSVVYKAGNGCYLYLNSEEKAKNTTLTRYTRRPQGKGPITIGSYGTSWYLEMTMDDLSIWNRPLTTDELFVLYNSEKDHLSESKQ